MVTISKFSYENPRFINLLRRRSSIPEAVGTIVKEVLENVLEFMRGYSVIKYPEGALKKNADCIITLAESENMMAHALAVKVRK